MRFSRHKTTGGRTLSVFQMDSQHIKNCIKLWKKNLELQNYKKLNFVEIKIKLYSSVLEKRNYELQIVSKRDKRKN